jgi:uncharacterized phage-associated protein
MNQERPPYDAKAIANWFLAKQHMTPMRLQKLVYFAHGWHLALYGGEPLIDEMIEAWDYGPVVPSLYQEFKQFGSDKITAPATDLRWTGQPRLVKEVVPMVPESDVRTNRLLERVWQVYGTFTAYQLSRMTHVEGAPWSLASQQNRGIRGADIPNPLIAEYFEQRARSNAG